MLLCPISCHLGQFKEFQADSSSKALNLTCMGPTDYGAWPTPQDWAPFKDLAFQCDEEPG